MGFFSRFSSPKVDEQKLSDLVFSMKTWFAPLDRDFKLDEKNLKKFAKYLILFNSDYKLSENDLFKFVDLLSFFSSHFKAGVYTKKLIPLEIVFALCLKEFVWYKRKSSLSDLEFYGLDKNILSIMFAGDNLMFFKNDFRYDTPIKDNFYRFSLDEVRVIIKKYYLFEKILKIGGSVGEIGRSNLALAYPNNNLKKFFTLKNFTFDLIFCKIYDFTTLSGAEFYPESNSLIGVYYKNFLVYYLGFEVLSTNKLFIRQIQGVVNSRVSSDINLPHILVSVLEEIASICKFDEILFYGSNCYYVRPFCHGAKKVEKNIVDKKYDVWAEELGYNLGSDGIWRKKL